MSRFNATNGRPAAVTAIAAFAMVCVAALGPARTEAADYTMVIPHLLPEDLTNNEVHPALVHFASLAHLYHREPRLGEDSPRFDRFSHVTY